MGCFYVNFTVACSNPADVAEALDGRRAFAMPAESNCVVVCDEQSDTQDPRFMVELATHLSSALGCAVLAVLNHDDDVLWYQLYDAGNLLDEYNSTPDFFSEDAAGSAPEGGDAAKLCAAFASDNVAGVEEVLRRPGEAYVFALDRHNDLIKAAGLSSYALGACYLDLERGELHGGLTLSDVLHAK